MSGLVCIDFECELPGRSGVAYCQVEYLIPVPGTRTDPPEGGTVESLVALGADDNELALTQEEERIVVDRFLLLLDQRLQDAREERMGGVI